MCLPGTVETVRAACVHDATLSRIGLGGFPVHHRILGADLFALENLANLDRISPPVARRSLWVSSRTSKAPGVPVVLSPGTD